MTDCVTVTVTATVTVTVTVTVIGWLALLLCLLCLLCSLCLLCLLCLLCNLFALFAMFALLALHVVAQHKQTYVKNMTQVTKHCDIKVIGHGGSRVRYGGLSTGARFVLQDWRALTEMQTWRARTDM